MFKTSASVFQSDDHRVGYAIVKITQQFENKKLQVKTLQDIEDLYKYEENYLTVIRGIFDSLPTDKLLEYKPTLDELCALEKDRDLVNAWRAKYERMRGDYLWLIDQIEDFPITPDFDYDTALIYDDGVYKINEPPTPIELPFRLQQAHVYFHQIIETFCSLNDSPTTVEDPLLKLPDDFYRITRTRINHRNYIISPRRTYTENYERLIRLFLDSAIKEGKVPKHLPCLNPSSLDLPYDHPLKVH